MIPSEPADEEAQCQHIRFVSWDRIDAVRGNVGPATLFEIREVLGLSLDISWCDVRTQNPN